MIALGPSHHPTTARSDRRAATTETRARHGRVLYIASALPARSETFVYREVLGLSARGWSVPIASVRAPERGLGDRALDQLAGEAIPVYGRGLTRLVFDAMREIAAHPLHAIGTLAQGAADILRAADVRLSRRPRIAVQCLAALALAHRIRPLRIEHLHAHMAHVPTTIAMYAARQLGIGFSFTGHAADLFRDRGLLELKLRRAAFVCCISRWHRNFYRELVRESQLHLPVVRCAVDVAAFAPNTAAPDPRERGRFAPTILTVGRLVPKKGFDLLIRALAELRSAIAMCRCVIVGDGPERRRLKQLCTEMGLDDTVEFHGAQSNESVRRLMREADLFVLPCRVVSDGDRDGIPVVLMEAMASGLPVISGDLPAIRELIDHERSGLLVDPERTRAGRSDLARVIGDLLHDPEKRIRLARAGRRRIEDEFSLHTNLSRIERAFEAAIGLASEPVLIGSDRMAARRASGQPEGALASPEG